MTSVTEPPEQPEPPEPNPERLILPPLPSQQAPRLNTEKPVSRLWVKLSLYNNGRTELGVPYYRVSFGKQVRSPLSGSPTREIYFRLHDYKIIRHQNDTLLTILDRETEETLHAYTSLVWNSIDLIAKWAGVWEQVRPGSLIWLTDEQKSRWNPQTGEVGSDPSSRSPHQNHPYQTPKTRPI